MTTEKVIETVKAAMKALLDTTPKEWDESICDYVFTDKDEIERILEANRIACETLGKEEKYAWHDLRKNPEDLPENQYGVYLTMDEGYSYPLTADGFWISNPNNGVIAWHEIEPFEEDNE